MQKRKENFDYVSTFIHPEFSFLMEDELLDKGNMQQNPRLCNSQHLFINGISRFDDTSIYLFFIWRYLPSINLLKIVICFYSPKYFILFVIGVSSKVINVAKNLDKYVKMIMEHPDIDERFYDDDMMKQLHLDDNGGICDGYCHHYNCTHYLIEGKSASHISKAIGQLKNTASQLIADGRKIDRAIILCDKIPKYERRLYRKGKDNSLCKNFGNIQQIYLLGKIGIYIHYKRDISGVGVSCLFG